MKESQLLRKKSELNRSMLRLRNLSAKIYLLELELEELESAAVSALRSREALATPSRLSSTRDSMKRAKAKLEAHQKAAAALAHQFDFRVVLMDTKGDGPPKWLLHKSDYSDTGSQFRDVFVESI